MTVRYKFRTLLIALTIAAAACIVLWATSAPMYLYALLVFMAGAVWPWINAGRAFRKGRSNPLHQPIRITPLRAAILAPWFAACMYVAYIHSFGILAVIAVNLAIVLAIRWLGNPWRVRD